MIKFEKNIKKLLPYNRRHYYEFWDEDFNSFTEWNGVSFQLKGISEEKDIGLTMFIENYAMLFNNIVSQLDNGSFWIVNHDDKDLKWFPNEENNLCELRTLFKQNNIPNSFKGALIFTKVDLLKFSNDILSYPFAIFDEESLLYKNLDISHGELPFIIKISGHFNIDLLTTDKELLKKVVNENTASEFIIKEYRGTFL